MKPLGCLLILLPGASISCQFKASLEGIPSLATIAITIPYFKNSLWRSSLSLFYGRLGLLGSHHLRFRTEKKGRARLSIACADPPAVRIRQLHVVVVLRLRETSDIRRRCDFEGKVDFPANHWEAPSRKSRPYGFPS